MTASSDSTRTDLEDLAWQFLASEFTGPMYGCWPIEDRINAFLLHHKPSRAVRGGVLDVLVQRVMANISAAHRLGVLAASSR